MKKLKFAAIKEKLEIIEVENQGCLDDCRQKRNLPYWIDMLGWLYKGQCDYEFYYDAQWTTKH